MLTERRRTRGFTLAEVLVATTLVAILAAVMIPTIKGRLQDGYEDGLSQEFNTIATAVTAYRQDVGKYPPRLDYLSALPTTGSIVDRCGNTLSATAQANWHGPYMTRPFPQMQSNQGIVIVQQDTLLDTLVTTSSPTGLAVRVVGLYSQTAKDLDLRYDGVTGSTSGMIQYSGAVVVTLNYIIPTKSGAC